MSHPGAPKLSFFIEKLNSFPINKANKQTKNPIPYFSFKDFIYLFDGEGQLEREHKQGEWEREKQASH